MSKHKTHWCPDWRDKVYKWRAICGMKNPKFFSPSRDSATCKACIGKAPPSPLQRAARVKFEALGAIGMIQANIRHLQLLFPKTEKNDFLGAFLHNAHSFNLEKAEIIRWYTAQKKVLGK